MPAAGRAPLPPPARPPHRPADPARAPAGVAVPRLVPAARAARVAVRAAARRRPPPAVLRGGDQEVVRARVPPDRGAGGQAGVLGAAAGASVAAGTVVRGGRRGARAGVRGRRVHAVVRRRAAGPTAPPVRALRLRAGRRAPADRGAPLPGRALGLPDLSLLPRCLNGTDADVFKIKLPELTSIPIVIISRKQGDLNDNTLKQSYIFLY